MRPFVVRSTLNTPGRSICSSTGQSRRNAALSQLGLLAGRFCLERGSLMPAAGRDDTRGTRAPRLPCPGCGPLAGAHRGCQANGRRSDRRCVLCGRGHPCPPTARYAAILCRGVLNDITDNDRREAVFAAFARALRPNGALILHVREWGASAERKTREPVFRKRVSTDRGELTFTSVTELDAEHRLLLISERHELVGLGDERVSDYQFVMRCWEREELSMLFARHGFGNIQFSVRTDHGVEPGATDRLIAVVQLSDDADKP